MNWCILIPLLVGLISALLGYLLGKLLGGGNNDVDIDVWKNKVASLEADLEACNKSKINLEADLSSTKSSLTASLKNVGSESFGGKGMISSLASAAATLIAFDAGAAKAAFGKKVKENDLKIVEGIGPKIEGLFHSFDIKTWQDLGSASLEKCKEVLKSGGDRYKIHNPKTWSQQAQLAYEGKWKELVKWQDELDGGK